MISSPFLPSFESHGWHLSGILAVAIALCWPVSVGADTLVLRDGKVVQHVTVVEKGFDGTLTVLINQGSETTLPRERYLLITAKDLVLMKNGSMVEGTVKSVGDKDVVITVDNADRTLTWGDIRQVVPAVGDAISAPPSSPTAVVPGTASTSSPTAGGGVAGLPILERAKQDLASGRIREASVSFRDAARAGLAVSDATSVAGDIVGKFPTFSARLLEQRDVRGSFELHRDVRAALADPASTGPLGGPPLQNMVLADLDKHQSLSYLTYARSVLSDEDTANYPVAVEVLLAARTLSPGFEPSILLADIKIRMDKVNDPAGSAPFFLQEALGYVTLAESKGQQEASSWRAQASVVQNSLNRKLQQMGLLTPAPTPPSGALPPGATPTPPPTPIPTAPVIQMGPPPDSGVVTLTPTDAALQTAESTAKRLLIKADQFSYEYLGMPSLMALGIAIGALILGWVGPLAFINSRINKGDGDALRWQGTVRWLGPLGFLGYTMSKVSLGGFSFNFGSRKSAVPVSQHPCPECAAPLDRIELYRDFNFSSCPNCKADIQPLFTLEDYLQGLMNQLEQAAVINKSAASGSLNMGIVERETMQRLIRGMVTLGIRRRASDIHTEAGQDGGNIRMRIDGVMYDMVAIPRAITNAFVSAIKVMANLDISERRVPQDGKIAMQIDGVDVDIRINTAPSQVAERVTMRLLDSRSIQVDSSRLGLEGKGLETFENLIRRPAGVIYLTGPTGSGKTTTLYVALNTVNDGRKNIITIEDPIEYQLKGINQMQVNIATGFTFATGLRSVLRSDPDVIMIGEVRDKETAEIAVDAASTGHLVFTTLHTIDACTVVPRLFDLGVEPRRVASSLLAAIAQRLIRVNCPECRRPYQPSPADIKQLGLTEQQLQKMTFHKGMGCESCVKSGFQGRIGLFEMMVPDEGAKELIESGGSIGALREMMRRRGMTTLREEAISRVAQGVTTVEEVLLHT